MVSVAAYFSNNQGAFVSAETILSIDFGTVFPGMSATESFTIAQLGTEPYPYTLTLTSISPPAADMTTYIKVWKDPGEIDTEDEMEFGGVFGDLTGAGTFGEGDLSDKWFVTFYVPDVTLDPDTSIEYGCQISIVPNVDFPIPPPDVPADLILRPDAAGSAAFFTDQVPASGAHFEKVAEVGSDDDGTTYVSDSANEQWDLYNITDVAPGTNIGKITLYAVISGNGTDMTNGYFGLQTAGTQYWGTRQNLGPLFTLYARTYVTNPDTGSGWTADEINDLQVGFYVDDAANSGMYATQIYVVVDVTP
jgi:hypothetical protein